MVGWLVGRLVDWLVSRSVGWLVVGWLVGCYKYGTYPEAVLSQAHLGVINGKPRAVPYLGGRGAGTGEGGQDHGTRAGGACRGSVVIGVRSGAGVWLWGCMQVQG